MLQPLYLLQIDADGAIRLGKADRSSWVPALVVPRSLCVFESLPCKGLAWHERGAFARLQVRRLAPFARSGANACIRGGQLMLWFWDHAEVLNAVESLGLDLAGTRVWVETLMRPAPRGNGPQAWPAWGGGDEVTLQRDAIVASQWRAEAAGVAASGDPERLWPWSIELTGQRLAAAAPAAASGRAWSPAAVAEIASFVALAGTVGYAAYWGAQAASAKDHLVLLERQVENSTQQLGDLSQLRSRAATAAQWVRSYASLSQGLDWPALLALLGPVLERHGVVMKEAEVRGDEARITLASAGSDIDMPALLRSFAATPGLSDVQLRAGLDLTQATFSFRVPGAMRGLGLLADASAR